MHLSAFMGHTGLVETLPAMHGERWGSPALFQVGVLGAAPRDDGAPRELMDQLAEDMDELMRLMPRGRHLMPHKHPQQARRWSPWRRWRPEKSGTFHMRQAEVEEAHFNSSNSSYRDLGPEPGPPNRGDGGVGFEM